MHRFFKISGIAYRNLLCLLLLGICSLSFSQLLKADATLLDKPEGTKVGAVKAGTAVSVVKRQGLWAQLQTANGTGWVRLGLLSFGGASGVVALDTGRAGTGNVVSTSAARGLSSKDLLSGRPNTGAVLAMDNWIPDPGTVEKFASEGGVTTVNLTSPLRAPPPASSSRKSEAARPNEE